MLHLDRGPGVEEFHGIMIVVLTTGGVVQLVCQLIDEFVSPLLVLNLVKVHYCLGAGSKNRSFEIS